MTVLPSVVAPARSRSRRFWAEAGRVGAAAVAGALLFVVGYGSMLETAPVETLDETALAIRMLLDVVIGATALALLPFRREAPLTIAAILSVLAALSSSGSGAAAVAFVSLVARRRAPATAAAALVLLVALVLERFLPPIVPPGPLIETVLVAVGAVGVLLLIGVVVGNRRALVDGLRREAGLAAAERTAREQAARAAERNRIAREMHDSLAHRLSLLALHANALGHRDDLPEGERRAAAVVVAEQASAALADLRTVLGDVRGGSATAAETARRPQPGFGDLQDLVEEAVAAGDAVTVRISDAVRVAAPGFPEAAGRDLYRIVQEALTNARKHAPGRPVLLTVDGGPRRGIRLRVENRMSEPVSVGAGGHGLVGVAERAAHLGGTATAGPDPDGRFVLEAEVPWPT